MKNIRKNIIFSFLAFFFCFSFIAPAFSVGEYDDDEGKIISFRQRPKESHTETQEKELFVNSFAANYKGIPPEQIKSHFKSREDVTQWLEGAFDEEWEHFKSASHPVNFIDVFKGEKLIGFAIVEQWNNEIKTLHIRQMAILPNEQRHGYGSALIEALKKLPGVQIDRIIADTRKMKC